MAIQKHATGAPKSKGVHRKVEQPQEIDYRGGKIITTDTPFYINSTKTICTNSQNAIDQVVEKVISDEKFKKQYGILNLGKKGTMNYSQFDQIRNVRGDFILNAKKENSEMNVFESTGISKYLSAPGVGILPVGRYGIDWYPSKDDFIENFEENIETFTDMIKGDSNVCKEFLNAIYRKTGKMPTPEQIYPLFDKLKTDATPRPGFMNFYIDFLMAQMKKIVPTTESALALPIPGINLDCMIDGAIGGLRFDEDLNKYKTALYLYAHEIDGKKYLMLADPSSSNGSTVRLTNRELNPVLEMLRKQQELDKNDKYLTGSAKNGKLEDFVKEQKAMGGMTSVVVNLMRDVNSPITHVPLFELNSDKKEMAMIGLGDINQYSGEQANLLLISNRER